MGSPLSRRPSRANTQEHITPGKKPYEQPVNSSHKLYRTKPCRNFAMGHCRFGDKCAYLHLPPTPHNLSATPLPAGYLTSPTPALSPLHSFASDKAILAHLPPSPTSTDGTSSSSGHNSVEDLTAMMQQYTFGPVLSVPGSGLVDRISLPPVPPCTPAIFDPLSTPQSTAEVRLVPVPVPVPIVPAVLRRGSEGTIRPDLNSKGESYLRNRSRSLAYGVNLFKTKPCSFYVTKGRCLKGDRCNFIHESPEIDAEKARQAVEGTSSPAPSNRSLSRSGRPTPISIPFPISRASTPVPGEKNERPLDTPRRKSHRHDKKKSQDDDDGFHPISWRVIGGGVMMSGQRDICRDYVAGRCKEEGECKFAHPEHDPHQDPISSNPTGFYPTTANYPLHVPIQAGHFFDPLGSPIAPYYFPSSPPSSTATNTSFSSLASLSPPVSPQLQRRHLRRRKSTLRKELKLSVDTSKSDRQYTTNRIYDGRTLLEFSTARIEEVLIVDESEVIEVPEKESNDLETKRQAQWNEAQAEDELTEGGLFSPRFIVRPVSTPPTPISAVDNKRVVRLFSAEMP